MTVRRVSVKCSGCRGRLGGARPLITKHATYLQLYYWCFLLAATLQDISCIYFETSPGVFGKVCTSFAWIRWPSIRLCCARNSSTPAVRWRTVNQDRWKSTDKQLLASAADVRPSADVSVCRLYSAALIWVTCGVRHHLGELCSERQLMDRRERDYERARWPRRMHVAWTCDWKCAWIFFFFLRGKWGRKGLKCPVQWTAGLREGR